MYHFEKQITQLIYANHLLASILCSQIKDGKREFH